MGAININTSGVNVIEAPDPHGSSVVKELSATYEMKRFFLLHWHQWYFNEVGAANYVPLEFYVVGLS